MEKERTHKMEGHVCYGEKQLCGQGTPFGREIFLIPHSCDSKGWHAKDKMSLEKQSCWEVAPPHPCSVHPQLGRVIPGSCYHKEREAELTAAVTKIMSRDSRKRARPKLEWFMKIHEVQGLVLWMANRDTSEL